MWLRLQDLIALRQVLLGRVTSETVSVKVSGRQVTLLRLERKECFPTAVFVTLSREILPREEAFLTESYVGILARRVRAGYQVEESDRHPHRYFVLATAIDLERVTPCRALAQLAYLLEEFDQLGRRR